MHSDSVEVNMIFDKRVLVMTDEMEGIIAVQ